MLYLTIPFGIFAAAVLAIAVIAWRKMPYLRKLTPEAHPSGKTVLHDYAPELIERMKAIPWRQALHGAILRIEDALRGIRDAMRRLDQASDRILHSVRRDVQKAAQEHEKELTRREEERRQLQERDTDEVDFDDPEQLKAEEQRLIVAIAQNPKDHGLYSDLARIAMRMHNWKDAVESLGQAAKLEPENEQYRKRLERARRKMEEAATG